MPPRASSPQDGHINHLWTQAKLVQDLYTEILSNKGLLFVRDASLLTNLDGAAHHASRNTTSDASGCADKTNREQASGQHSGGTPARNRLGRLKRSFSRLKPHPGGGSSSSNSSNGEQSADKERPPEGNAQEDEDRTESFRFITFLSRPRGCDLEHPPPSVLATAWSRGEQGVLTLKWSELVHLNRAFMSFYLTDERGVLRGEICKQRQEQIDVEAKARHDDIFGGLELPSVRNSKLLSPSYPVHCLPPIYEMCWQLLVMIFSCSLAIRLVCDDPSVFDEDNEADASPLSPLDSRHNKETRWRAHHYQPTISGVLRDTQALSANTGSQLGLETRLGVLTWFPNLRYLEIDGIPVSALIGWSELTSQGICAMVIRNQPQLELGQFLAVEDEFAAESESPSWQDIGEKTDGGGGSGEDDSGLNIALCLGESDVSEVAATRAIRHRLVAWECLEFLDLSGQVIPNLCVALRQAAPLLPSLRRLSLAGCALTTVPDTLWRLRLEWLDISRNALRNCHSFDPRLAPSLTHLDLHDNCVANLRPLASITSLQWLDVSRNSLQSWKAVTSALGQLSNLRHLWVHDNPFEAYGGGYRAGIFRGFMAKRHDMRLYLDGRPPSLEESTYTQLRQSLSPSEPSVVEMISPQSPFADLMASTETSSIEFTHPTVTSVGSVASNRLSYARSQNTSVGSASLRRHSLSPTHVAQSNSGRHSGSISRMSRAYSRSPMQVIQPRLPWVSSATDRSQDLNPNDPKSKQCLSRYQMHKRRVHQQQQQQQPSSHPTFAFVENSTAASTSLDPTQHRLVASHIDKPLPELPSGSSSIPIAPPQPEPTLKSVRDQKSRSPTDPTSPYHGARAMVPRVQMQAERQWQPDADQLSPQLPEITLVPYSPSPGSQPQIFARYDSPRTSLVVNPGSGPPGLDERNVALKSSGSGNDDNSNSNSNVSHFNPFTPTDSFTSDLREIGLVPRPHLPLGNELGWSPSLYNGDRNNSRNGGSGGHVLESDDRSTENFWKTMHALLLSRRNHGARSSYMVDALVSDSNEYLVNYMLADNDFGSSTPSVRLSTTQKVSRKVDSWMLDYITSLSDAATPSVGGGGRSVRSSINPTAMASSASSRSGDPYSQPQNPAAGRGRPNAGYQNSPLCRQMVLDDLEPLKTLEQIDHHGHEHMPGSAKDAATPDRQLKRLGQVYERSPILDSGGPAPYSSVAKTGPAMPESHGDQADEPEPLMRRQSTTFVDEKYTSGDQKKPPQHPIFDSTASDLPTIRASCCGIRLRRSLSARHLRDRIRTICFPRSGGSESDSYVSDSESTKTPGSVGTTHLASDIHVPAYNARGAQQMTPDGRFVPYLCDYSPLSQLLSSEDYNKWISQSNQALSDVIPTRQLSHKSLGDDCPEFFTTAAAARDNVHSLKEKPIRLTVGARTRPSINSNLFFST